MRAHIDAFFFGGGGCAAARMREKLRKRDFKKKEKRNLLAHLRVFKKDPCLLSRDASQLFKTVGSVFNHHNNFTLTTMTRLTLAIH